MNHNTNFGCTFLKPVRSQVLMFMAPSSSLVLTTYLLKNAEFHPILADLCPSSQEHRGLPGHKTLAAGETITSSPFKCTCRCARRCVELPSTCLGVLGCTSHSLCIWLWVRRLSTRKPGLSSVTRAERGQHCAGKGKTQPKVFLAFSSCATQ